MKQGIISIFILIILLMSFTIPSLAANDEKTIETAIEAANQLYELGLFNGTGIDSNGNPNFELERIPTRNEAITMLVRILGKEQEAKNGNWDIPFTDVAEWAKPYVGYAYNNSLTNGISPTTFGGNDIITASQYLTFVLRALGYSSDTDFKWDVAWELSDKLGFTNGEYCSGNTTFLRGDVAQISFKALSIVQKNSTQTLAEKLINSGAFTAEQYDVIKNKAIGIKNNHKILQLSYSFVRIDGKLYEVVYSYELKHSKSNVIYYDEEEPSDTYIHYQISNDMWQNTITLSLLTNTYKTTTSDNPFVYKAIDMFSTYYNSSTINIEQKKHYLNATENYYTLHHSYKNKTLNIPIETINNKSNLVTTINDIRYCGEYINLEDYCKFFSLDVSVKVEYDEELKKNILVIDYL